MVWLTLTKIHFKWGWEFLMCQLHKLLGFFKWGPNRKWKRELCGLYYLFRLSLPKVTIYGQENTILECNHNFLFDKCVYPYLSLSVVVVVVNNLWGFFFCCWNKTKKGETKKHLIKGWHLYVKQLLLFCSEVAISYFPVICSKEK